MKIIDKDISKNQTNKARAPLVVDIETGSKKSRRKERGLTIYQPCSRRHGDYFSVGIDFLKMIPREIAITRIYMMLISSQGFIKHADRNIRAKKFGMSRTSCDKMFSSEVGKDLFSIKDHRTGIVSCSKNSGYSIRCMFVKDINMSSKDFDKLVAKKENRSARTRAFKKKARMEIDDPLYTTIPIDLNRIKILLSSGEFRCLRHMAKEVLDLILYTSSISQCAVIDRGVGSVHNSSDAQSKKGIDAAPDKGSAIEGSVKGLEVSASRDVIRRRTGLSKNRQRKLESEKVNVITKRIDRRKVFTGTVDHCDAFIRQFKLDGYIGKCFMVATTRKSSNGERFYDVYCQAPNSYRLSFLRPGQKFFYKIGSEGKRPVARKHTSYDPLFGYMERLKTYASDDEFKEVCSIDELENLKESEERTAYDEYCRGFHPEYSKPSFIIKEGVLSDASIGFASSNRFYRKDLLDAIGARLKVLNKWKNIYESNLRKLCHVQASPEVPFEDFNAAFATFNGYTRDRKGRNSILLYSNCKDVGSSIPGRALRRAFDGILSTGGKKDRISLLERTRRRLNISSLNAHGYDFVDTFSDADLRSYRDKIREIVMILLHGFDKRSYSYVKWLYLKDLRDVLRTISDLLYFQRIINGEDCNREDLSESVVEEYIPLKNDPSGESFLTAGNNFKIWDTRKGDSLSEATFNGVPFSIKDLRLLACSLVCKLIGLDSSAELVLRERIINDDVLPGDSTCFPKEECGEVSRDALRGIIKWFSGVDFAWCEKHLERSPLFTCDDDHGWSWDKAARTAEFLMEKNLWRKFHATNRRYLPNATAI